MTDISATLGYYAIKDFNKKYKLGEIVIGSHFENEGL